jgi:hypothetical protein
MALAARSLGTVQPAPLSSQKQCLSAVHTHAAVSIMICGCSTVHVHWHTQMVLQFVPAEAPLGSAVSC